MCRVVDSVVSALSGSSVLSGEALALSALHGLFRTFRKFLPSHEDQNEPPVKGIEMPGKASAFGLYKTVVCCLLSLQNPCLELQTTPSTI